MLLSEDFLRELLNRGYSENTISSYKRDLALWENFRKARKPVQEFYRFLTQKKLSPRSQARVISCVRSYLKFLQTRGHSAKELKFMHLPPIRQKLPQPIRLQEFKSLWRAAEGKTLSQSIRNQLVLSFLYGLGCRVSELVSLNLQDFNETEAWISLMGKGGRERLLPLTDPLYKSLLLYLKESRPHLGKVGHPALFFNNKGRRPSRVDIWRWLKAWSLKAGFKDVKNPHSFRHGLATGLLEKGADLRAIQKLLGHLSIGTTQIYTSVSGNKLKEALDEFHPLSQAK